MVLSTSTRPRLPMSCACSGSSVVTCVGGSHSWDAPCSLTVSFMTTPRGLRPAAHRVIGRTRQTLEALRKHALHVWRQGGAGACSGTVFSELAQPEVAESDQVAVILESQRH